MIQKPVLVMMSYRGGPRLTRCLESIAKSADCFSRIILSITAPEDSDDMNQAREFKKQNHKVEILCTQTELPTMQHQAWWVDYLKRTGIQDSDWIYWLAYDDEVRVRGIHAFTDADGNWPLESGTAYFGPWAMRHESPDILWAGDRSAALESWTSFPAEGPLRLPVMEWIRLQLKQPTYMQMSGSVCEFASFYQVRHARPRKRGPMRIEMAIAASTSNLHVAEFSEPLSMIYGRSNSDRASYGSGARKQDVHLALWLARYCLRHPTSILGLGRIMSLQVSRQICHRPPSAEEWRVRGMVES